MPAQPPHPEPTAPEITLIRAGAVCGFADDDRDTTLRDARPGAVALAGTAMGKRRVIAAGPTAEIERAHLAEARRVVDRPGHVVMPGMVNAHAHLELTVIGPRPYTGSFTSWVRLIQERRVQDAAAVADSVHRGVAMLIDAGVDAVGDIGGARFGEGAAWEALRTAPLSGGYFPELLAFDGGRAAGELARLKNFIEAPRETGMMRRGVSPHAPYSTGRAIYEAATRAAEEHGLPVTTHLAEMREEHQFVADASGPFRVFLEELGVWEESFARDYAAGLSAVRWMEPFLRRVPWLLAHCNYVSDDDLALLAETDASVAYCPIASEYFGHVDHRYRDILDAGINVCLGTDSIVCQPANAEQPLGILPQMRRLYRRDRTDPALLLRMATRHGRRALGLDDTLNRLVAVAFDPGESRDALTQVLESNHPVEAIALN